MTILLDAESDIADFEDDTPDNNLLPEVYAERDDLRVRLGKIIDGLSEVQKQTVILYYFNELKVEEVAYVMECNVGTVKSRLFLARNSIRSEIEEEERKSGQEFYGIAGIPMLPFGKLLAQQLEIQTISPSISASILSSISETLSQGAMGTAQAASVAGASTSAVSTTAATGGAGISGATGTAVVAGAVKAVSTALIIKIAAGIVAAAVVVTGIVLLTNQSSNTPEALPDPGKTESSATTGNTYGGQPSPGGVTPLTPKPAPPTAPPVEIPVTPSAVITLTPVAEPEPELWRDAYAAFLRNGSHSQSDGTDNKFGLTDMDNNGIPELVLHNEAWKHCLVFTYSAGAVTEAGSFWGDTDNWAWPYINGIMVDEERGAITSFWTLRDGQMVEVPFTNSSLLEIYSITDSNIQTYITGASTPVSDAKTNPHFYATALREFFAGATGHKAAVLVDLDGDGEDEVVAVKVTRAYEGMADISMAVFDVKDGRTDRIENIQGVGELYFSTTSFIIYGVWVAGPTLLTVLGYENGGLVSKIGMREGMGDDDWEYERYDLETGSSDSINAKYGIDSPRFRLFGGNSITDHTTQILAMTAIPTYQPTTITVYTDDADYQFTAYPINGENYFNLRDLAYALNGTSKQFEIGWEESTGAITLNVGMPYTPIGSEMAQGDGQPILATSRDWVVSNEGDTSNITGYRYEGSNIFRLRDIMEALDIGVEWDASARAIRLDTSKPYTG